MEQEHISTSYFPALSVQWHVTNKCNNHCRHCYLSEPQVGARESRVELSRELLKNVLYNLEGFALRRMVDLTYVFTGGDPLLREDFYDFLKEIRTLNRSFIVLGNPETLTAERINCLREFGLKEFQISLDGLEQTHDWVRGQGSFLKSIEAIRMLSSVGVFTRVMCTVYSYNAHELPTLMEVAAQSGAGSFTFDMGIPIGNARTLGNVSLSTRQMRRLCHAYLEQKNRLKERNYPTRFIEKNGLLLLARYERDEFGPYRKHSFECFEGCHIGWTSTCIMADGAVLTCRRFPEVIGKLPEQPFEQIWLGSPVLRGYRRRYNWHECGDCDLYPWCRGCPAVTHSLTEVPMGRNPLCWKDQSKTSITMNLNKESSRWPINCSNEEEWKNLPRHLNYATGRSEIMEGRDFRKVISKFLLNPNETRKFMTSPESYSLEQPLSLQQRELLHWTLTRRMQLF